jgi:multidrug efflux pump subunit AcrA (membrane-fusion protein)
VDATLDESGVAKVKAGQQAVVTFDAIAGQQFRGQVASVTPSGTTTQGVVTFPVTITFDPKGTAIPTGLTATVKIVTQQKENVVAVSSRAVTRQGNQATVNVVKEDGTLESRTVQTGITGDSSTVEIVSGLSEGEKVAIPSTTAQRTGTATSGTFGTGGLGGSSAAPAVPPPGR